MLRQIKRNMAERLLRFLQYDGETTNTMDVEGRCIHGVPFTTYCRTCFHERSFDDPPDVRFVENRLKPLGEAK